jgi:hypothetical protein
VHFGLHQGQGWVQESGSHRLLLHPLHPLPWAQAQRRSLILTASYPSVQTGRELSVIHPGPPMGQGGITTGMTNSSQFARDLPSFNAECSLCHKTPRSSQDLGVTLT